MYEYTRIVLCAFFIFLTSLFICCSSLKSVDKPCPYSGSDPFTWDVDEDGNFCGKDSFVIKTTAIPHKNIKGIKARRKNARNMAISITRLKLLEIFSGLDILAGHYEGEWGNPASQKPWMLELKDVIMKGEMVSCVFDDQQNCTILYVIRKQKIKEWYESLRKQNARKKK